MKLRFASVFILFLSCLAYAQTAIPVAEEPFHRPVFKNEFVRILDVAIPPGRTSLMHHHDYDYVFVMLRDGSMTSTREDGYSVSLQLNKGDARLTHGKFSHTASNDGDTPLKILAVELLKGAGTDICGGQSPACEKLEADLPVHKILVETDRIRVTSVHMEPGVGDMHRHDYPHLLVAVDPLRLRDETAGKQPVILRMKAGEYKWFPGSFTHTLTSLAKTDSDFVIIEFKEYVQPTAPIQPTEPEPGTSSDPNATDEDPDQ